MVFDATSGSVGPDAGHVHCRLSWSSDGKTWAWVDAGGLTGRDFIPAGPQGTFDSHVCFAAHSPIRMPDGSARLYYMGGNGPHSGSRNSSFAVATLPPDRFAGYAGSADVVTRNVTVTAAGLTLTVDILAPGGFVTIGVMGHGSGLARSAPVTAAVTDHVVSFPGAPGGLEALVGVSVQLSLVLRSAAVYTVGFQ